MRRGQREACRRLPVGAREVFGIEIEEREARGRQLVQSLHARCAARRGRRAIYRVWSIKADISERCYVVLVLVLVTSRRLLTWRCPIWCLCLCLAAEAEAEAEEGTRLRSVCIQVQSSYIRSWLRCSRQQQETYA